MLHINTHMQHNKDVQNRVLMRLSIIITVVFISISIYGQAYVYNAPCGNSTINAADILANANDGSGVIPPGQRDGTWSSIPPALTFSTNNEFAQITGAAASTTYNMQWNSIAPPKIFDIQIVVGAGTSPTVNSFSAINPTPCGAPYSPQLSIDVTGGTPFVNGSGVDGYTLQIEDELGAVMYNSTLYGNNISIGSFSINKTMSLVSVTDANGCKASGLPSDATFTLNVNPSVMNVNWGSACTDVATTIDLTDSENGVEYVLRYDNGTGYVDIESWTSPADNTIHSFANQNAAGTYQIFAKDPCGGGDIAMSGGPHAVSNTPTAYAISIVGAGPYCAGSLYTVRLVDSELNTTYRLYSPSGTVLSTINGTGNAINFPNTTLSATGNYSVVATSGSCTTNMLNTVYIGAIPIVHNISGGNVCNGLNLTVGLVTSTGGINYTLVYDDGASVTMGQTITPPTISFNAVSAIGTYAVVATDPVSGCTANMNGSASINTSPTIYALNNQGSVCPNGEVSIGALGNPVEGATTTYILERDGVDQLSLSGNNGILTFGDQTVAGEYTVRAERGGCSVNMTGSLNVYEQPSVLLFTANKTQYCQSEPVSNVNLTLSNIEEQVQYQLQRQNGAAWDNVGGVRIGSAGTNIVWLNQTLGVYRVLASNAGGCSVEMNSRLTITEVSLPTAAISAQAPVRRCANVAGNFTLNVTITGNAPYDFDIVDDKGNTIVNVVNYNLATYTINVNPADAQTTYSVINLVDAASCSPVVGSNTATVYVDPVPTITFSPANPEVCLGSAVSVTADGAGVGGSYVWSDGLGANSNISVAPSTTDTYTVTASNANGCISSNSVTVTVNPLPVLTFDTPGSIYEYCQNDPLIALTGNQAGATFSGSGVDAVGNLFNPATANIGANQIQYQYTDPKGCYNSLTKEITVNSVPSVNILGLNAQYCADETASFTGSPNGSAPGSTGTFTIIGYETEKGNWWDDGAALGSATINVGAAINAIGAKTIRVRYTYEDPKTCTAVAEQDVILLPDISTNLSIAGLPANICETAAPITLTPFLGAFSLSPVPAGETVTFSGPNGSITNNANGTATFDPGLAGAGNHTITLDYTDINGCSGSASGSVQIGTTISIPGLGTAYCSSDANPVTLSGSISGNPTVPNDGTTFDIIAPGSINVALNQANGSYDFIPATLFGVYGSGTYQVIYKYTDGTGCLNTITSNVEIIKELSAIFTIDGTAYVTAKSDYCENDGLVSLVGSADLTGVASTGIVSSVFTGNGTSGNGIVGGYFNPQDASVTKFPTPNTITHTVIHTINGVSCQSPLETFDVTVVPVNVAISGINATDKYCTNEGTSIITVSGADASGGDANFFATKNGSATPFLTDNNDNTAEIDPSVGAGIYEITMEFTKTVDGCKKTITRTVEVYTENPVTFSGVTDNQKICQSSGPITLRGDMFAGGIGNFVEITPGLLNTGTDDLGNAAVADDGVAILTPTDLPIGIYTITYEYTNANGCVTTETKTIEIVGAPSSPYNVIGGGAYCIDDVPKGVTIGLDGSNTGVTYELLFGGASLTPAVTYTGTGAAFNFTVNNNGTGGDKLFVTEGVYTVKASLNSCDAIMNSSALVEEYELVLTPSSVTNISCTGLSDGIVTLSCTGGSGSYEYSIDGGTTWQASPTFTGLALGNHDFSVKDLSSAACENINGLTVNINQPVVLSVSEVVADRIPVGCSGCVAGVDCEGSATILISGGTPYAGADLATYPDAYEITWSTGGNSVKENLMPAGNHSVNVTDKNGCTVNTGITITTNPVLTITENIADHEDNICKDGVAGSYTVTAAGGSGTYEFSLTDPATTPAVWLPGNIAADQYQLNNLEDGSFDIWVRDADTKYNRCITKIATPIIITEPVALSLVEESQVGITCNGANDGSFIVRASGGLTGTYEFTTDDPALVALPTWVAGNSGADGFTQTLLTAGTYKVWVRDLANPTCDYGSVSVVIADIPVLSYTLIEYTNVSCNLGNSGRLEVLGQGGSGNYVYSWRDNTNTVISTDAFAENLDAAGSPYELTLTDAPNGCGPVVQSFVISEPTALNISNVVITSADCVGQPTGAIELEVDGGTPPYNVSWSNGVNVVLGASGKISITNLAPGNYNISITDDNGCNYNNVATPWVVNQLSAITLEVPATVTNNTCNGDSNGSIYVKLDGGSGDYQFRLEGAKIIDWSNSTSATLDDFTFTGLVEGNYDVKVRDKNNTGCEYTIGNYTLTDPAALNLTTNSVVDVDCYNSSNGSITITATGGSGTYQFNVDNLGYNGGDNAALFTQAGLSAGNHTVWVRDSKATSCEYKLHPVIFINQPNPLNLTISNATNVKCNNDTDGEVVLTATGGGGNYDYSKDGGVTWDVGLGANHTYSNLSAQAYTFAVRDRNAIACGTSTINQTITEPTDFTTTAVVTNVNCFGKSTGQISLTSIGGVGPFTYSIDGGTNWLSSPLTNLAAATYVIDVKDNGTGCIKNNQIAPADATITQPTTEISIGAASLTNVTCYNGTVGEIDLQGNVAGGTVVPAGDYQFTWYKKVTPNVIVSIGSDVASNLSAGTYFVVIGDDNGCEKTSADYVLTQPNNWNVSFTASDLTKYNSADGAIDVHTHTGNNPGHSIEWFTVVGGVETTMSPLYDDVFNVTTFAAGTYRFKITDNQSCEYVSNDITLTQPLDFDVTTSSNNVTCYGGTDGRIDVVINSGSSDYTIDVVGTLNDGSPNYSYPGNATQTTNTYTLKDLKAGSYYIELLDNGTNETFTTTIIITEPAELTITATPIDITCNGDGDGQISVVLAGNVAGATISWTSNIGFSDGPLDASIAANLTKTNLQPGDYTLLVDNNNGCPAVTSGAITINDLTAWNVAPNVIHVTNFGNNNGSIEVPNPPTGNTAPYQIEWADLTAGGVAQPHPWIRSSLTAGDYTYTITDKGGAGTCTYSETVTVTQPNQLLFDLTGTDATCYGYNNGTIGVGVTSGNQPYRIELTGTDYDGNAVAPPAVVGNATGNYTFTGLKSGTYNVAISDFKGENLSKSVTINHLAQFSVNEVTSSNITCNSGNDGSIEVELTGRVIDETVATINWTRVGWSVSGIVDDNTTDLKVQTGLEAGTYTVNVSDQFGCDATPAIITLTEPDAISATNNVTHVSTNGGTDGRIFINNVISDNGVKSIVWYKNGVLTGVTGNDNNNIGFGAYYYIITDNNNCTYTSPTINVTEPGVLTVNAVGTSINCYGDDNGIISVNITSGQAPFVITLTGIPDDGSSFTAQNSALSNAVFTDLKPGTYSVNVTDGAAQASTQIDIVITQNAETILNPTLKDITCFGDGDGEISLSLTGNVNAALDNWQVIDPNGATIYNGILNGNNAQTVIQEGSYKVIVTNQDGCVISKTYNINEPDAWNVNHNVVHVTPTGNNNGEINIDVLSGNTPNAGTPDYNITWSDGLNADARLRTGLLAGTYSYAIEDSRGCIYNSGNIDINEPADIQAVVTSSDVDNFCYGDALGQINVVVSDGNEPYSVRLRGNEYDGGSFDKTVTINTNTGSILWDNLKAGDYSVDITDNVGNTWSQSNISITHPNENVITPTVSHISCNGAQNGAGEIIIALNRAALASDVVTWWGPSGIIKTGSLSTAGMDRISVTVGGDYTYSFSDANGCTITNTIKVNEPTPFTINWDATDATINGLNNGIIDVHTVSGNNGAPYSITWTDNPAITGFIRNDLVAGTYEFTIEDKDGCSVTNSDIIGEPFALTVGISATDAKCYGDNNGAITVTFANPNNGGLSYQITGNQDDGNSYDSKVINPISVNSTVSGLYAGTYTIDAYDSKGTHYHQENIRVEQEPLVTLTGSITDITCFGDADGRVSVTLNGRAPLSTDNISWSGSKGYFLSGSLYDDVAAAYINNQIDPVATAEEFTVTVTSAQGCTYQNTFEVKEPKDIKIAIDNVKDVTCINGNDGSIAINVTGRAGGGYTYVWRKKDASNTYQPYAGNAATITGLQAGEYEVEVSSISDVCKATLSDIKVLDGAEIVINETITDITTCKGDNSGIISISVADGISPYIVNVTGQPQQTGAGDKAFVFDNLLAGTYVIEVSDARGTGCSVVNKSVDVLEPALGVTVSNIAHDIDCDPLATTSGTFSFDITGGNVSGGNYNYQILLPEASLTYPINVASGSTSTQTFNNLKAGTYNLTVLDLNSSNPATCAYTYQFALEHIVISTNPVVNTTCKGINNGAITGVKIEGASANYTYLWTTTDGGIGIDNTTLDQSGLSKGTYVLTVTDPGRANCVVSKSFVIDVDHTIEVNPTIKDVSCNGGTDGSILIDVTGISATTNYIWAGSGIVDNSLEDQINLTAGNYSLQIETEHNGVTCIANKVYTVAQPNQISYFARYEYTSCDPYQRTLIVENETGGTGNYTYYWDGPAFTPVVPADPTNVVIYEGGTYTIKVKDDNNCELSRTLTIPKEITINPVVNHVKCDGGNTGSIVLNVAGGSGSFNFNWSGPSGYSSTNRNIDKLYAGIYTIVITDNNENDGTGFCFRSFDIEITDPEPIVIDPTVVNTSCFGKADGQIEIEVTGGSGNYTYNWSPVIGTNLATNKDQYNLPADVYTVSVTDGNGCFKSENIVVEQDDEIILTTTSKTDTQCDGTTGAIDITVTGGSGAGFSYDWSSADGSGIIQGNEDQTGLTGGVYTVIVSDNGVGRSCTATISETLTEAIEIFNDNITPVTCSGNDDGSISFDVKGGDGNYTYAWTVISGDATRIDAGVRNQSGLSEGEYEVTITDGRTSGGVNCAITKTFIVPATTGLIVNVAMDNSNICFGEAKGKLTASVTGGSGDYIYKWNGVVGTAVLNNRVQGIYGLEVIDKNLGCNFVQSYEIKGPAAPLSIDNIVITDVLCKGDNTGEINVTVSGGTEPTTGYIYTWTKGTSVAAGSNPTGLLAGKYDLTVTDDNGCTVTSTDIEITEPSTYITVDNPQITDVSTVGGSNGVIEVDVYDGVAPRSVQWYKLDGSNIYQTIPDPEGKLNPLTNGVVTSGTYQVIATDNNGCSATLNGIKVVEPGEPLGFEKTVHQISPCNGADNGEIHINRVFGGFPINGDKYRIQVTGPGTTVDLQGTSKVLTGLTPGTYTITVTDNAPETYKEDIIISEYAPLSLSTTKVNDVTCFNGNDGEISVEVSGGKANASNNYLVEIRSAEGYYSYKDNVVANTPFSFTSLPAGNFTITLKDHADDFDTKNPDRGICELSDFTLLTEPAAEVELTSVSGDYDICTGDSYDLSINTSNWNFANGNLRVSVYDDFQTNEYVIDKTPFVITVNPTSSRTYEITKVSHPTNAACLQGQTTGNQVQLTVHQLPTANITGPKEVCEDGSAILSVNFTGKKPFTFTWIDTQNNTSDTYIVNKNDTIFTNAPLLDASYSIINVSDGNGCSNIGNGQVDVSVNNKPSVTLAGSKDICIGNTTPLIISFNENKAPYTITYEELDVANKKITEGTLIVTPDATNKYTWNVSPIQTTTYKITQVTDTKGCAMDIGVTISATVIVKPLPKSLDVIKSTKDAGEVCQGVSNIDYSVEEVNYATNYLWSVDAGMTITSGNGTANITIDFDRGFAGGYVRVYAENTCGVSSTIERWVNAKLLPDPILAAPSGDQDLCEGATGVIYTINPVANATSYEWLLPAGFILQGDGTGTSIIVDLDPNIPSTVGDIYVRPVNGCSNAEPWSPALTVNVTPLPVSNAGPDERICGTTYTLKAAAINANEAGEWQILKGSGQYVNKLVDQIRPNAQINNLSQGENKFVWTVTNKLTGCSTTDTVSIFNDQVTVNAGAERYKVCDATVKLYGTPLANVDNADEAYWTSSPNSTITGTESAVATGMQPDATTFTYTIRKGACYSSASIVVTNNETTTAEIYDTSGSRVILQDLPCGTNSTSLSGSVPAAGETGYWRIESGSLSIDDVNKREINITNIEKGDHIISWNILKGDCFSKETVTIRNNALVVDAGKDKYSCDGTTMLYGTTVPSDATGQWSIIDGFGNFDDGTAETTLVSGLEQANNGLNVFRWTLTRNGCESYDEVTITNDTPSAAEITGGSSSISICDYEYKLHAITPTYGNGFWSVAKGQGKFDDASNPNTLVTNLGNGDNVLRWTVLNNTCSSSVDFTVRNLHVDAYAGADTAVCSRVAQLNATPAPQGASGEWSVVSGQGGVIFNPSIGSATASATSIGYGVNTLVWTITQNGCKSTDTVNVSNNRPYPVSASTYIYTDGNRTTLRAGDPVAGNGVWTLVEGRGNITNPNLSTTEVTNLLPNFNYFRWTVTNVSCVEYVDVAVQSGVLAEAEAGADQLNLCDNFTTLHANEPEGTFGEWTVSKGGGKFESTNTAITKVSDLDPGVNIFKWTLRFAGGSENSKTDSVIIVNNKPSEADAGLDIFECGNSSVLNARMPVIGEPSWSILSGGGEFADNTDPKTAITKLSKGENVIKYQIKNDICFSFDTVSVFNFEPSDAYAGENQIVCQDSALLNPEIPQYGEGSWRIIEGSGKGKDNNGLDTDKISSGYVYKLAPGINKLVWEVKVPDAISSCVKRDTITIENNMPSIAFAGHNRPVCTDSVSLSGSLPIYGKGTWTLISGSGEIADSSLTNTDVIGLAKGKNRFRWTIDNKGCTSTSDVEISNNLIEAFAGYEQVNCVDTAVLEANNPLPGEGTWGVLGGSGSANFDDNESPLTRVRKLDKGENILTWTISYKGCQSVSEVKITNNKPSDAIAGDNKATCINNIVLGASTPEVGVGKWTIRSGGGKFVDDLNPSTKIDSLKFGENVLRWTVENEGCILYDDVAIEFNKIDAVVGGQQDICEDHTFLEANNPSPGTGSWTVVGGTSQARFVDSNDPTTEVRDLAKGSNQLRWTINNKGCITSAEVNVINHSPSTAYAGNTQEKCISYTTLDATPVSIGTGEWEVLTGSAIIPASEINNPKANITGLSKGDNVFRWKVTSDNGLCSSQDDVDVINNEPSDPYAGRSEEYCNPTVVLKAAEPDFGTGLWSIIDGGGNFNDASLPNATISNLNEGDNVLRWTVSKGQCVKESDITITNNTPTTANAGPDIKDCKNYAFLDANNPTQGSGSWKLVSGNAEFIDVLDSKTKVEGLTFGDNILMWSIQKGSCISTDQITVFNKIPDQAAAGTDKETCENYLTLNANNPTSGSGEWLVISGNGDFDDITDPNTIVRNLGLGENRLKWVVSYGSCTTEDEVEIISNKASPYAGEDDITYESSYELKASNPGKLGAQWKLVAGTGDFVDDTFFNTKVNNLTEGINTYRWTMDINGCVTYDDVSIEYRVVPDAGFIVDTIQGCYPLTVQFTNYSDGGTEFMWDFGDGNTSKARNPVHTFENPGLYNVILSAPGPDNVNGEYSKDIIVHDHPIADFSYSPDTIYVPDDLLRCYSTSVDAKKYLWSFGDGGTSTDVNPEYEYKEEGVYDISLEVESEHGCTDKMVKENAIISIMQGFVAFPNSFMPRPDGGKANTLGGGETGTVFRPVYSDVEKYKLQIFNRWGQLIYESTDIDEGWNGFFNGTLAPQAVYVWKATGTFISGKEFNEAGSVLLVR